MATVTKVQINLPEMLSLPINVADHSKYSVVFFILGFILTCWFLLYVVSYKRGERKIVREILLGLFASIFGGGGSFFLLLSFGINL